MPNIEIHGLTPSSAEMVYSQIRGILQGEPDIVVTRVNDLVHDLNGKEQPFLRVMNCSDPAKTTGVIEKLRGLGLDIESVMISSFTPKRPPTKW